MPDKRATPGPSPGALKPWMTNRPGESNTQRVARLMDTCYACGWECHDGLVLDMHQDVCDGSGPGASSTSQ